MGAVNKISVGSVCRCKRDKLAVITSVDTFPVHKYNGICFDGSKWQSVSPEFVAKSIEEYIDDLENSYAPYIGG